jgi:SNF family Na+-dependent transporter
MEPFWSSFCDYVSQCGRNAALFYVTLAILFVLLITASALGVFDSLTPAIVVTGVCVGVIILAVILRWVLARRRASRQTTDSFQPLSYEEWRKARSKLLSNQNVKRR